MGRKYIQRSGPCQQCGKTVERGRKGIVRKFCTTECWYEFKAPVGSVRPAEVSKPQGYMIVKVPPGTHGSKCSGNRAGRWMLQHRFVMQQILGRPLRPGENVHHINGIKNDNRPENLELWCKPQPIGIRAFDVALDPYFQGVRM